MKYVITYLCTYSFLNVSHWIVELKTHTYTCSPKVILCGNKIDLTSERKVDSVLVTKLFKDFDLTYIETSAFTGQGINDAMEAIAKLVLNSESVFISNNLISTYRVFISIRLLNTFGIFCQLLAQQTNSRILLEKNVEGTLHNNIYIG